MSLRGSSIVQPTHLNLSKLAVRVEVNQQRADFCVTARTGTFHEYHGTLLPVFLSDVFLFFAVRALLEAIVYTAMKHVLKLVRKMAVCGFLFD